MRVRRSSRCYWIAGSKGMRWNARQAGISTGFWADRLVGLWCGFQGRSDTRPRVKEAVRIKPMIEFGAVQRRQEITQSKEDNEYLSSCATMTLMSSCTMNM